MSGGRVVARAKHFTLEQSTRRGDLADRTQGGCDGENGLRFRVALNLLEGAAPPKGGGDVRAAVRPRQSADPPTGRPWRDW